MKKKEKIEISFLCLILTFLFLGLFNKAGNLVVLLVSSPPGDNNREHMLRFVAIKQGLWNQYHKQGSHTSVIAGFTLKALHLGFDKAFNTRRSGTKMFCKCNYTSKPRW